MEADCPHCDEELDVSPASAGTVIDCPACGGKFRAPLPGGGRSGRGMGGGRSRTTDPTIKTCVLISGISNVLFGLGWSSTCILAIIGVPQLVLAIFEIIYFASADGMPPDKARGQAKVLAIFEIICGLANPFSLIAGIIVLVKANHE